MTELRDADWRLHAKEQELLRTAAQLMAEQVKSSTSDVSIRLAKLEAVTENYGSRIWMMGAIIAILMVAVQIVFHYVSARP